jgi:glycosyltransferase involved in cell wall biosynthesis
MPAHLDPASESPLVTIGVMVYNNKDTLVRALECLVHQDYAHKELVICDDASTDGSYEICQDYARRYPFIRLYRHAKNLGCFANLDFLLTKIRGTYFLWACPDDVYDVTFVRRCVAAMLADSMAVMATSAITVQYDSGKQSTFRYKEFDNSHPFNTMAKMIIDTCDSEGKRVYYNSIIHTIVRTDCILKIYDRHQNVACEELWVVNGLIWGHVAYVDDVLYTKYESIVPYEVRNPGYFSMMSAPFARTRAAFRYLLHYGTQAMSWSQKWSYVKAFWWVVTRRVPHLFVIRLKEKILYLDARFLGKRFHKVYRRLGLGVCENQNQQDRRNDENKVSGV